MLPQYRSQPAAARVVTIVHPEIPWSRKNSMVRLKTYRGTLDRAPISIEARVMMNQALNDRSTVSERRSHSRLLRSIEEQSRPDTLCSSSRGTSVHTLCHAADGFERPREAWKRREQWCFRMKTSLNEGIARSGDRYATTRV